MLMIWNWQDRKRTFRRDGLCLGQNLTSNQRRMLVCIWDVYWPKDLPNCMMVPRFRLWPTTWKVCWSCQLRNILTLLERIPNWNMYLLLHFRKKQRNTFQELHVQGTQRTRFHVHGVRTNLILALRCSTNLGLQGETSPLGSQPEAL